MKIKYILLTITLCSASFVRAAEIRISDPTPENAAIRSSILPGWGQYFNGSNTKAVIFAATELGLLTVAILSYSKASNTYDDYKAKGIADDSLYDDYKDELRTANTILIITAIGWIYNVIDAYVFSPYNQYGWQSGINMEAGPRALKLSYKFKIS